MNAQRPSKKKQSGSDAYKRGYFVEYIARLYLRLKGYKIIAKNYKTPVGEIDIIAQKGKTTAFVEVKYRADKTDALYAIPPRTQKRVSRAAEYFIAHDRRYTQGNNPNYTLRFDIIACGQPYSIVHIKNAWLQ
jgi:putative endonuclease